MSINQLVLVGDSLTQGNGPAGTACMYAQGGKGAWVELVTDRLANISGVGPLLSSGIRGTWVGLGTTSTEWAYSGSWTITVSTDAWDRAPYGGGSLVGGSRYANGLSNTVTWTKPSQWGRAIVGFAIYWIDYTNGGNWQYSIDGGAWTNIGQSLAHDNQLCKFYVSTAVTSSVGIRCYDGATGVGCLPVGIEVFYSSSTSGLIVHNLGLSGTQLHELCQSTSGDRMAFFDSVRLGTGSPISNQPNAGVGMMHINDVLLASTSGWNTDLTTFYNRVSSFGPVGFVSPWECATASYNQTQQTNYRAQTKTSATSLGAKTYDIYDAWSSNGFTANSGAVTAGYLAADTTHEAQAGHLDLANRLYWFIRNQLLGLGSVPTAYQDTAKAISTTYSGKTSNVVYSATPPLST